MSTTRVDIAGQFSGFHPKSSLFNKTEIKVVRETEIQLQNTPSNWSSFCDAADDALRPMLTTKKLFRTIGPMIFALFLILYAISNILPFIDASFSWTVSVFLFVSLPMLGLAIGFAFFWCWINSQVKKTMAELDKVCEQYSSNGGGGGFRYTLQTERWGGGGCKQKRYYITVDSFGGADSSNNADIEQAVGAISELPTAEFIPTATPTPRNEEYHEDLVAPSETAETGNGGNRDGPSIFDQLTGR
jgi:hypothetical protein